MIKRKEKQKKIIKKNFSKKGIDKFRKCDIIILSTGDKKER